MKGKAAIDEEEDELVSGCIALSFPHCISEWKLGQRVPWQTDAVATVLTNSTSSVTTLIWPECFTVADKMGASDSLFDSYCKGNLLLFISASEELRRVQLSGMAAFPGSPTP